MLLCPNSVSDYPTDTRQNPCLNVIGFSYSILFVFAFLWYCVLVMRWAGHVACMEEEVCTRFWWGNLRERDHWGDQDVDGRIILR